MIAEPDTYDKISVLIILSTNNRMFCVDLVLVPVWVLCVPLAALPARSTGFARSPHLPVDPASSEAGAIAAVCLIGAAEPSLPVCPLVATILVLSKSSFASCLCVALSTAQVALQGQHSFCWYFG